MSRLIVYHSSYGCETGCCGHRVELGDNDSAFQFKHCDDDQDPLEFAKQLVTETYGAEHVTDLDWANCQIYDYDDKLIRKDGQTKGVNEWTMKSQSQG